MSRTFKLFREFLMSGATGAFCRAHARKLTKLEANPTAGQAIANQSRGSSLNAAGPKIARPSGARAAKSEPKTPQK